MTTFHEAGWASSPSASPGTGTWASVTVLPGPTSSIPGSRLLVLGSGCRAETRARLQARADRLGDAALPRRLQELPTRPYRRPILEQTDLFLCTTERAKTTLLLEGASEERIVVSPPGVDLDLFVCALEEPDHHLIVSAGRLVWEKGHQESRSAPSRSSTGRMSVGSSSAPGRRRSRLRRHADELGLGDRGVPPRGAVRRDAVGLCAGLLSGARQHPDLVFGRAVRHGARRGDGRRPPRDRHPTGAIPEVLAGNGQRRAGDGSASPRLEERLLARHPASASYDEGSSTILERSNERLRPRTTAYWANNYASARRRRRRGSRRGIPGSQPIRSRIPVSGIRRCMSSKPSS